MIAILDFGSQYTQLIARRVREAGVYCEILPYNVELERLTAHEPAALILSGGPASIYEEGAPHPQPGVLDLDLPMLGICYGMGVLVTAEGGKVASSGHREYGPAPLTVTANEGLFSGFNGAKPRVWMSHGDRLESLPPGWSAVATSKNSPLAAAQRDDGRRHVVQFHPEVVHTERGSDVLSNFMFKVSGLKNDWSMESFVDATSRRIKEQVGDGHVICGLSGGVDSTVTAALLERAVPGQLTCVFVNNGLLRKDEADEVKGRLGDYFGADFVYVDASDRFLDALAG
ncbi:MAG TPA: glutamine-hydrolyzing GMP synthase, partial [candidate division UBP10 bacterium]|nr:glutamine-hydrolyzing GMP synthase [Candidatus Binatota bacterium]